MDVEEKTIGMYKWNKKLKEINRNEKRKQNDVLIDFLVGNSWTFTVTTFSKTLTKQ
jgi:hypothetical protein